MAVTFDSGSQHGIDNATEIAKAHTVAGSDRLLLVALCNRDPSSVAVNGITYGGVSMSLMFDIANPPDARIRLYGLLNPPLGTNDISASFGALTNICFVGASYTGVHQTTPSGSVSGSEHEGGTDMVHQVSSSAGELVVGFAHGGIVSFTAGTGQTERAEQNTTNACAVVSDEAGSAIVEHTYTLSTSRFAVITGVSLKPSGDLPFLTTTNIKLTPNLALTPLIVNNGRGLGIILRGQ